MIDAENGDFSHPMDFLLETEINLPQAGEVREGVVVAHSNNEILIDIGAKSEGLIESREISRLDEESLEELQVGNEVQIYVVNPEDRDGNIILSYAKAAEAKDWVRADELQKSQDVIDCKVIGFNRGGMLVALGQLRGFVPNSQIGRERNISNSEAKQKELQTLIGSKVKVKVIEVDQDRNRLILSEQAARKEIREARRTELLATIEVGDVREGRVVNLADFGAFVDIGGIEGLVHLSELSWKRVNNPNEILKIGDNIEVYVLNVDDERQRIALSTKRLEPDPWTTIEDTYYVGQLIGAEITRLTKFGAFARLDDDYQLEGLIHVSEMAEDRVEHPREVVSPNDNVSVRIIRIDPEQRQLGLSLKQVTSDKYMEADLAMLKTM